VPSARNTAQYRMVYAERRLAAVAGMEAAIPDAAALVFACLGVALALHGRRALRAPVDGRNESYLLAAPHPPMRPEPLPAPAEGDLGIVDRQLTASLGDDEPDLESRASSAAFDACLAGVQGRSRTRRPRGTFAETLLAVPLIRAGPSAAAPGVHSQVVPRPTRSKTTSPATGASRTEANRPDQVAVFHHPKRTVLTPQRISDSDPEHLTTLAPRIHRWHGRPLGTSGSPRR
jgi:hypothetical protein